MMNIYVDDNYCGQQSGETVANRPGERTEGDDSPLSPEWATIICMFKPFIYYTRQLCVVGIGGNVCV